MNDNDFKNIIYQELPKHVINTVNTSSDMMEVFNLQKIAHQARYLDTLDRQVQIRTQQTRFTKRRPSKRKKYLSCKERVKAGLNKLPKNEEYNWADLEPMRKMWLEYVADSTDNIQTVPKVFDGNYSRFHHVLNKLELVGADVRVVQSKCPHLVNISGTVVLETKNTLQVVTRDNQLKILLKKPSVFEIVYNRMVFTFFGKHWLNRSADRSVKKNKNLANFTL